MNDILVFNRLLTEWCISTNIQISEIRAQGGIQGLPFGKHPPYKNTSIYLL